MSPISQIKVDGLPLCIASGGNIAVAKKLFSKSRRFLAVVGKDSECFRAMTFVREEGHVGSKCWVEVGSPSMSGTEEAAEKLALENLKAVFGEQTD